MHAMVVRQDPANRGARLGSTSTVLEQATLQENQIPTLPRSACSCGMTIPGLLQ